MWLLTLLFTDMIIIRKFYFLDNVMYTRHIHLLQTVIESLGQYLVTLFWIDLPG